MIAKTLIQNSYTIFYTLLVNIMTIIRSYYILPNYGGKCGKLKEPLFRGPSDILIYNPLFYLR